MPPPKQQRLSKKKRKTEINTAVKQVLPPAKKTRTSSPEVVCLSPAPPLVPEWYHTRSYNPLTVEDQHRVCNDLGLQFVCANGCTAGGPLVPLRHPISVHHIRGDGNCLFRAFSYAISGSERQHLRVRSAIIRHMRCTDACMSLLGGYISDLTIDEYIQRSQMAHNYVWGSQNEMFVLAHMAGVNIASYNTTERQYHFHNPGVIDINAYPDDNSRPCI